MRMKKGSAVSAILALLASLHFVFAAVDDSGMEALKKAAEESPLGQKAEYRFKARITESALPSDAARETKQNVQTDRLDSLNIYAVAANSRLDGVNNRIDTNRIRLEQLSVYSVATNSRLDGVNSRIEITRDRLDSLNVYSTATNSRLDGVNSRLDTNRDRLDSLNVYSVAANSRLDGVNSRLDSNRARLESLNLYSDEIEPRLGAITETAPSTDTDSSGLNGRLQRIAQRLSTLIAFYANNFGSILNAIRTAAQLGDGAGNAITSQADIYQRSLDVGVNSIPQLIAARAGQMFHSSSNTAALTGTTEVAYYYFKNPNGSGKNALIYKMTFGPTLGNNYVTYRIYRDPTSSADGTALAENGNRDTGQSSAVVTVFTGPTVSANGSFYKTIVVSGLSGQTLEVPYDFSLWVEPNHSLLITRQLSANTTIGGVTFEWKEQP